MTQPLMTNPDVLLSQTEWLHHLARQLVGSREAQEDLVQETYLQALSRPNRDVAHPGAFLGKVMRRLAARSASREAKRGGLETKSRRNHSHASTEDLVERITVQRDLVNALLSMSKPQRDVLILRFYENMGPTEIATELGIPLATAKSRQQRGLEMLREKLTGYYGNEHDFRLALAPLAALANFVPKAASSSLFSYASIKVATALLVVVSSWGLFQLFNEDAQELNQLSSFGVDEGEPEHQVFRSTGYQRRKAEVDQTPPQGPNLVQVKDAEGKAVAGVPISITAQVLSKRTTIWRGNTKGPQGTINVSGGLKIAAEENRCAIYRASLGFPVIGGLSVEIDPDKGLEKPLVATLPVTGKIQINLFDQTGKPFAGETTATFSGLANPEDSTGFLSPYSTKSSVGQVTLPYVGLGLYLLVEFDDPNGKRPPQVLKLLGPKTAKKTITASFTMASDYPTIEGKLTDKTGAPLAEAAFRAAFSDDRETNRRDSKAMREVRRPFSIETDSLGRFKATWPVPMTFKSQSELVIGEHVKRGGASVGWAARAALPAAISDPKIKVGTLILDGGEGLIRGHVVDIDGKPIEGAYVNLFPTNKDKPTKRNGKSPFKGMLLNNRRSSQSSRTTTSGSFAFKGDPEMKSVGIEVRCEGYARTSRLKFDLPNEDLGVVLLRAGSLSGSIKLQSPTDAWGISLRTARQTETTLRGKTFPFRRRSSPVTVRDGAIRRDGSFTVENIAPGLVDIEIQMGGRVVKTIAKLEVKAGENAKPKLLQGIELKNRSPLVCIQLLDDQGIPMAGRSMGTTKTQEGRFTNQTTNTTVRLDGEGRHYRAAPQNPTQTVDLAIVGWKAVSIKVDEPTTVVHLERGPKIEVEFADYKRVNGKRITLKLQRKLGRRSRQLNRAIRTRHRYTAVLEDGKATFFVSAYGDFKLDVEVEGGDSSDVKFTPTSITVEKMETEVILRTK